MNIDKTLKMNITLVGALCFFLAMFTSAIAGGILNYSAVPHWDAWKLWKQIIVDGQSPTSFTWLWSQHNEHRLVITRILFWLDYTLFSASHVPLILLNYIFALLSCIVFHFYVQSIGEARGWSNKFIFAVSLAISGWLFSLMQWENFYWEFQSQFFLAQLLPFTVFFLLFKSKYGELDVAFWVACVLGVLSAGCMANGVLALPMAFVYLVLAGDSPRKKIIILLLSIVVGTAYFRNYTSPAGHDHLLDALRNRPVEFFNYVTIYLGAPFGYIFKNKLIAIIFGVALIEMAAFFFWKIATQKKPLNARQKINLSLLFFIGYVMVTAVGTAGGRLIFGIDQALSNRYTTPTIMAWSALFVILANNLVLTQINSLKRYAIIGFCVLFVAASLAFQMRMKPKEPIALRKNAALSLAMGVNDASVIRSDLNPDVNVPVEVAFVAKQKGILGFGQYPLKNAMNGVGAKWSNAISNNCIGHMDMIDTIDEDARFFRVQGWIYDNNAKVPPKFMRFVDKDQVIRGYALTGIERDDVAKVVGRGAKKAGFLGYIDRAMLGEWMLAYGDEPGCRLDIGSLFSSKK